MLHLVQRVHVVFQRLRKNEGMIGYSRFICIKANNAKRPTATCSIFLLQRWPTVSKLQIVTSISLRSISRSRLLISLFRLCVCNTLELCENTEDFAQSAEAPRSAVKRLRKIRNLAVTQGEMKKLRFSTNVSLYLGNYTIYGR